MNKPKLTVTFDWLEFTVLQAQLPAVMEILDLKWENFSPLKVGRFGYKYQVKWTEGNVFIMYNRIDKSNEETVSIADTKIDIKSGAHVMITGRGCKEYAVNHDLMALFKRVFTWSHRNFSRIDLALDDIGSKIVNFEQIHEASINGWFTSRWSKWDELNSRQTSTNDFLGQTIYFGSQKSDLYCRIYNKTLERKAKSNLDDAETSIPEAWTRLELVYRKDRALKLAEYIVNDDLPIGHALRGTLKQYLRFLIKSNDSNKARWPTAPWWDELLAEAEQLQLTIEKEAKTIEDMRDWVDRQISPTLSAILEAHEGDLAWFRSILAEGSKRLSQKHKDAITQFLQKEGTPA